MVHHTISKSGHDEHEKTIRDLISCYTSMYKDGKYNAKIEEQNCELIEILKRKNSRLMSVPVIIINTS